MESANSFVAVMLLELMMNGEWLLENVLFVENVPFVENVLFVVSMITTKNDIYLALHDKRHAVVVDDVHHSNHVRNAVVFDAVAVAVIHYYRMHRSQHCVANHTFVIHDCTLNHPYSFLTMLHQTRTHNTANNRLDVDNSQILRDIQMNQMWPMLLD